MSKLFRVALAAAGAAIVLTSTAALALDPPPHRTELRRADLSGAPGMEVIESVTEFMPGETVVMHLHHGIEAGYVLQGGLIQNPGKEPVMLETGTPVFNLRDVMHGGYTVRGDHPIKIFAVHIVDKGKPLYDDKP